jgi:hypothetical protein
LVQQINVVGEHFQQGAVDLDAVSFLVDLEEEVAHVEILHPVGGQFVKDGSVSVVHKAYEL